VEITAHGRFEGLDPWDFFLWPQPTIWRLLVELMNPWPEKLQLKFCQMTTDAGYASLF
jgi:hypothetical protein